MLAEACTDLAERQTTRATDTHSIMRAVISPNPPRAAAQKKEIFKFLREIKEAKPCCDCGISYPYYVMDYDHVRGKKVNNVSHLISRGMKAVKDEIKKCELVCSNCHRIRTYKRKSGLLA